MLFPGWAETKNRKIKSEKSKETKITKITKSVVIANNFSLPLVTLHSYHAYRCCKSGTSFWIGFDIFYLMVAF